MSSFYTCKSERKIIIFPQIDNPISDNHILSQMQGHLKYVINEKEVIKSLGIIKEQKLKKKEEDKSYKPIQVTQVKVVRSSFKGHTTNLNLSQPKIPVSYYIKRNTIRTCSNRLTTSLKLPLNECNKELDHKKKPNKKIILNEKKMQLKALIESVSNAEQKTIKDCDILYDELKSMQKNKYAHKTRHSQLRSCSLDEIIFKESNRTKYYNNNNKNNNISKTLITEKLNAKKIISQSNHISNFSPEDSYKYRKILGKRMGYGILEKEGEELIVRRKETITKQYQTPKWVREKIKKQFIDSKKIINLSEIVHKKYLQFMEKNSQRKEII